MLAFCLLPERRQGEWRTHEPIKQTHGLAVCSLPRRQAVSSTYGVAGSLRIIPEEPTGAHLRVGNASQMLSNLFLEAKEALSGYCVSCEPSTLTQQPCPVFRSHRQSTQRSSFLTSAHVQREGCFQNLFSVSQPDSVSEVTHERAEGSSPGTTCGGCSRPAPELIARRAVVATP